MMDKRYVFDKNHRYNETAQFIDHQVYNVLRPIMDEHVKQGYSPRDIAHLMMAAVFDIECSTVLDSWPKSESKE